ncbi:MAG: hypothetical protein IK095_05255 [Oscillospiraceae bacterium]|nr:hypothetical protein [Oscillospiraceae bacterium]
MEQFGLFDVSSEDEISDIRLLKIPAAPLGSYYTDEFDAARTISRHLKEDLLADGLGTEYFLLLYRPSEYIDAEGNTKKSQFSSLCFQNGNDLFCRICFRARRKYIEIPSKYEEEASKYCAVTKPKKKTGSNSETGYIKLLCASPSDVEKMVPLFRHMLRDTLDSLPTEFGCCSKYKECSDAKKCVNNDKNLALQCFYLKNLRHGHIFYGANKCDDGEFFS